MTGTDDKVQRLKALYASTTKHSHYQIMPDELAGMVDPGALNKKYDRFEKERFSYFQRYVPFAGSRVLDVGANTGYFSFVSSSAGAREVVSVEGNPEHAEFIQLAADVMGSRITVRQEYLHFNGPLHGAPFDVVLLLNVLHHVGDDFGERGLDIGAARRKIIENLNYFADKTTWVIFQIGFSWMTDYSKPLFANGTKAEMIDMVRAGVEGTWDIAAIGIAGVTCDSTTYEDLNESNLPRNNAIGEFRNRPVFILKSRRTGT